MTAVSTSAQNDSLTGTAVTVAKPASTASGDLLLFAVHCNNVTTIVDNNGGTAFTSQVDDYQESGAGLTFELMYRRATGSEPDPLAATLGTGGRWSGITLRITTPHATDVFDVTPSNAQQSSGTSINAPSITTNTANAIHIVICGADGTTNVITGTPAGYTVIQNVATSQCMAMAYKVIAAAGATGAQTFTYTSSNGAFASSFAIKDDAAGGGGGAVKRNNLALMGVGRIDSGLGEAWTREPGSQILMRDKRVRVAYSIPRNLRKAA